MTLIVKSHPSPNGKIVCVTDSDLIGKKFEEGNKQLDFTSTFYKGEGKDAAIIERMLTSAYLAIFSGEKSIELAKKIGLVEEDVELLVIGGIAHTQCLIG